MDLPTIWQKTRNTTAQVVNFALKLVRKHRPNRRVNLDRWANALQLNDKAIHDITNGSLSPSEPSLHGTQAEIVHWCDERIRLARLNLNKQHDRFVKQYAALNVESTAAEINTMKSEASLKVNAHLAADRGKILQAREFGEEQETAFEIFQKRNGLERGITLNRSTGLLFVAIAALAAIVTALVFYWQGGPSNLASWKSAASWGAAITLIPAAVGWLGIRQLNHLSFSRFLIGCLLAFTSVVVVTCAAITAQLAITHESISLGFEFLSGQLNVQPANLLSVDWTIAATIFTAGFACLLAGYALDDPYPGFGSVHRAMNSARSRYFSICNETHQQMAREVDRQTKRLNVKHQQASRRCQRLLKSGANYIRKYSQLEAYETSVQQAGNLLLDRYRQAAKDAYSAQQHATEARPTKAMPQRYTGIDRRVMNVAGDSDGTYTELTEEHGPQIKINRRSAAQPPTLEAAAAPAKIEIPDWQDPASFSMSYRVESSAEMSSQRSRIEAELTQIQHSREALDDAFTLARQDLATLKTNLLQEIDNLAEGISVDLSLEHRHQADRGTYRPKLAAVN